VSNNKISQLFHVPMMTNDIEVLIELLSFADRAALTLATQEIKNGSGIASAARFNRMSRDAQDFMAVLTKHIDVGEPTDGQVH